jgi:hypothetical protein
MPFGSVDGIAVEVLVLHLEGASEEMAYEVRRRNLPTVVRLVFMHSPGEIPQGAVITLAECG